jgi:HK97 gp10 family phage protein
VIKSVTVRGDKAIIANIQAFDHDTRERFRVVTRKHGQLIRDRVVQIAPKKTGYLARNTRVRYSPDEMSFTVGWHPEDFVPHGLPFYPPYVEFGTSRQAAQPSLRPAYEWGSRRYAQGIRESIRYAMQKRGRP